ncbi:hypothetical protein A8B78_11140 [Jannaschia sp. EhC01]|nr:hypothetical protein A8B78_11140 [Jannaschia sp. EhC01]
MEALAAELTAHTDTKATAVSADLNTVEGRDRLLAACPAPDILVNNNGMGFVRGNWLEQGRAVS